MKTSEPARRAAPAAGRRRSPGSRPPRRRRGRRARTGRPGRRAGCRNTWKARRIQARPSPGSARSSFMARPADAAPDARARPGAAQHALEVGRVVRLQHRRVARQVEVPQARDPEAQGAGAQHRRQQARLGARPAAARSRRRRRSASARSSARRPVSRSMHQSFRHTAMSNSQAVDAGEVEVEEAGRAARPRTSRCRGTGRHGSGRAAAPRRPATAATCFWKASSLRSSARLRGVEMGQHHRHGLVPPGEAAQVGLVRREVARRPGACAPASRRRWRSAAASGASWCSPAQLVDHRRRLAAQRVQQCSPARVGRAARAPGCRAAARCFIRCR